MKKLCRWLTGTDEKGGLSKPLITHIPHLSVKTLEHLNSNQKDFFVSTISFSIAIYSVPFWNLRQIFPCAQSPFRLTTTLAPLQLLYGYSGPEKILPTSVSKGGVMGKFIPEIPRTSAT